MFSSGDCDDIGLFLLYIQPISVFSGAYYAATHPSDYLLDLVSTTKAISRSCSGHSQHDPFPACDLYLLFSLNDRLVLSSTSSLKTLEAPLILSLLIWAILPPPRQGLRFSEMFQN